MALLKQTSPAAETAHVLRRLTFGPFPGTVAAMDDKSSADLLDALLGRAEDDGTVVSHLDHATMSVPADVGRREWKDFTLWWLDRMAAPSAGLHEKMVWFWHGHFTSTASKCGDAAMVTQHETLRQHALGNFRDFAKAMVADGAMMMYLDAAGSNGMAPNENLARELMELFTLGPGNYTEADVREASKVMAGWWVDWETGETEWDEYLAYEGVVRFMGLQGRFTREELVDVICDHDACAPFVAAKIHRYLVGTAPSDARLNELASLFRSNNLEIMPLLEAIVDHPSFLENRQTRPRYAVEWFIAANSVLGKQFDREQLLWMLEGMGQLPGYPPNPAGWAEGNRWISASMSLLKSNMIFDNTLNEDDVPTFPFDEENSVQDALEYCGVFEPSASTLAALEDAYWSPFDVDDVNLLLVHLCLTSPEFSLA